MATWKTPKTNWQAIDKLLKEDMNRIEGNLDFLVEREAAVRQMLANAITAMGRSASASETYQQLAAKIRDISKDANAQPEDVLEGKTFYSGGTKKTGVWPGPMFGAGTLGHYNSTTSLNITTTPGELVVRDYKSFRLNFGHTIWVSKPIRALIIRSWGDIVINGTINLDKKGGYGNRYITIGGVQYDLLGGLGGNGGGSPGGGAGGTADSAQRAAGGLRGGGGGGGGGGIGAGDGGPKNARSDQVGVGGSRARTSQGETGCEVEGTDGTYGAGGGGSCYKSSSDGYAYGGRGGQCDAGTGAAGGGGGVDARMTAPSQFAQADDGQGGIAGEIGGGALVLIAAGNIIINGAIYARGGRGADGGDAYRGPYVAPYGWCGGGGGGGGSGGGRVIILYRGSYANNGIIDLSGGPGGAGGLGYDDLGYHSAYNGYDGANGQAGSVQVKQLL